ncbi:hypothetical protein LCGC14_2844900 [marine sediment metagenome]|uniref:Uncharacterized protein n=1 Tax=marine sediment metagenome TaxID=412755 RepID=A0A0F9AIJ6_9ZZZZ
MGFETMGPIMLGGAILIFSGAWAREGEKKLWNGGWCPECRMYWARFDTDSQGGRGYKCICANYIWISYAVD